MKNKKSEGLIGGVILISIGLIALLSQFFDFISWESFGIYIVLLLGLVFLAWGILKREAGLLIPGGILGSIGVGIVLLVNDMVPNGLNEGGVFLIVFSFGWAAITLLSAIFTDDTQWWALIPGSIIGFVGLAVMFEGIFMNVLEAAAYLWPIVLIIVGLAVIWKARKAKEKSPKDLEY